MGRPVAPVAPLVPTALALHQLPGKLLTSEDVEGEKWHECISPWPSPGEGGPRGSVEEWKALAQAALQSATRAYEKKYGRGTPTASALRKEQTVGDRIASVTLRVQESPLHRMEDLRALLSFARKKGRRERMPAMEALKDLFVSDLLPSERQLVKFEDREFKCAKQDGISKRHLLYALFEGELKGIYRDFLGILEECGQDTLVHFKQKAVKVVAELLVSKPECEKELLSMLVNKLGDPDRKVSSTASYSLLQLIEKHHPQMRLIVVREVERLLHRPNITPKAQYFSISFLNQIRFAADDVELARWLLRIYMELFTDCLAREKLDTKTGPLSQPKDKVTKKGKRKRSRKKGQPAGSKEVSEAKESRLMGALLIGANRAFPFTKPEQDENSYQEHFNALFEVAHAKALGPATQALSFLFQVSQSNVTQSDRFYRALYSRIFDAAEAGDPKQAWFLNLLYKAMKVDTDPRRVKAYAKRLLQAALSGTAGFAGACAVVISECFQGRQFGALKSFVTIGEGDDAVEHFVDVDEGEGEKQSSGNDRDSPPEVQGSSAVRPDREGQVESQVGIVHRPGVNGTAGTERAEKRYNAGKRDPQYAGAERSCLWELASLCNHFHPSVSMFATAMCVQLKNVQFSGDALKDFSEIAFLDKFVYKKAKNRVAKSLYGKRSASYRDDPVANSAEFEALVKEGNIGEDDKFFARFFTANPDRVVREKLMDDGGMGGKSRQNGEGYDIRLAGEDGLEDGSEEEAFEVAMQAELHRLGGDAGFSLEGMKKNIADVDSEDEDELQAFEKAFEKDMMDSGGEGEELHGTSGPTFEDGGFEKIDDAAGNVSEKKQRGIGKKEGGTKRKGSGSVFAAAEDYREAIDANLDDVELEDTGERKPKQVRKRRKTKGKS